MKPTDARRFRLPMHNSINSQYDMQHEFDKTRSIMMNDKKIKFIASLFLSALAAVVLYIILHETGHTIVVLSAGAKMTEFSILRAHVHYEGGDFTDFSDLWNHANGMFLPFVVCLVYGLLYNRNLKNTFYRLFSVVFSVICFIQTLTWIVIPFFYEPGTDPRGEDVKKFLYNFAQNHSPMLVTAGAAVLFAIGIAVMLRKGIIRNFIEEIKEAKNS